jgi:uncharacterized membrane protein YphA (DoxX/SURF4 family)
MSVAGVVSLALGAIAARKDTVAAHGLDKLVALAFVFYAAPLAVFGAEHLTDATDIMQLIPVWMPARLFWAYFVGVALIAAGLSISLKRYLRLTGSLVALMFLLFVVMMHIPGVVENPRDRFFWAILFRDSSFGAGALALAGAMTPGSSSGRGNLAVTVARVILGVALIAYGVEHFLHPAFAPGVPLKKLTPAWVPLPHLWAYLAGLIEVVTGIALLINRFTRDAAVTAGLLMVLLTLVLYVPLLAMARTAADIVVGLNYVFDTLLYGGAVLLLAFALPTDRSIHNVKA